MAKMRKPEEQAEAMFMLASKETQLATAQAMDVSEGKMNAFAQQNRQAINLLSLQLLDDAFVPLRQNNQDCLLIASEVYAILKGKRDPQQEADLIGRLNNLGMTGKDVLSLSHKKEVVLLEISGVKATRTGDTIFNMLFAGKDAQDDLQELDSVKGYLEYKRVHDVQDAEYEEADGTSGQGGST